MIRSVLLAAAFATVIPVDGGAPTPEAVEAALRPAVREDIARRALPPDRAVRAAVSAEIVSHAERFARIEDPADAAGVVVHIRTGEGPWRASLRC